MAGGHVGVRGGALGGLTLPGASDPRDGPSVVWVAPNIPAMRLWASEATLRSSTDRARFLAAVIVALAHSAKAASPRLEGHPTDVPRSPAPFRTRASERVNSETCPITSSEKGRIIAAAERRSRLPPDRA